MHVDCWIQQVTTRVGAVTCWTQQPVSPKQVVGFTCVFNSEVDKLIRKFIVRVKNMVRKKGSLNGRRLQKMCLKVQAIILATTALG